MRVHENHSMRLPGCSLQPGTQYFGDTPCLRHTPPWTMRRFGVEDLTDAAHPSVAQMIWKSFQEFTRVAGVGMYFQPCVHEMPDEPWPDRALVICRIARQQITAIVRLVVRMIRAQRSQPVRRDESLADDLEH